MAYPKSGSFSVCLAVGQWPEEASGIAAAAIKTTTGRPLMASTRAALFARQLLLKSSNAMFI
ncbi:hypothetical protein T4B_11814 [Trichinella pseudospiralis]|uniref:Uncharacterized protein n=1 Tax=Trichinella pseudospiralis TaxID=6337 RepID=A0A0V1IC09_TRIPS|nr:hypothetical protein T4B_11814 [Trichinella pseudospiralis]